VVYAAAWAPEAVATRGMDAAGEVHIGLDHLRDTLSRRR
jgi:hypothetical protein